MKIKYFGMLVDVTGVAEEEVEITAKNVIELNKKLVLKYPKMAAKSYVVAQNNSILLQTDPIKNDLEVALLPPFAGG